MDAFGAGRVKVEAKKDGSLGFSDDDLNGKMDQSSILAVSSGDGIVGGEWRV